MGMVLPLLALDMLCWHNPDFLVKTDQSMSMVSGKTKFKRLIYVGGVFVCCCICLVLVVVFSILFQVQKLLGVFLSFIFL